MTQQTSHSAHAHGDHAPGCRGHGASVFVKDPVCGMTVDPATAKHRSERAGEVIHFCSTHCKTKFDANPGQYVK